MREKSNFASSSIARAFFGSNGYGSRSMSQPVMSLWQGAAEIVGDAARQWSQRVRDNSAFATPEAKIDAIFKQAYARPPTPAEAAACLEFINGASAPSEAGGKNAGDPYFRIAHAILNSKELIYVH